MDFKALLDTAEYSFLRTNPRLGSRIMLLGVSGSYGYGTNREGSDIDFRGVTLNLPSDLIGLTSFDQYEDAGTDTVIYSFNKLVGLLLNCNPNTIEILGLDDDQYVIKTPVGQELLDHLREEVRAERIKYAADCRQELILGIRNRMKRFELCDGR